MVKKKITVCATIDPEVATWIDEQVKSGKFRNRSHVIEYALGVLKDNIDEEVRMD